MIKFFLKNTLILLSLSLVSCALMKQTDSKKIRIVDLQGKSHGVTTRVPELNAQILRSQGKMAQDGNFQASSPRNDEFVFNGAVDSAKGNAVQNKYATADYDAASVELASQNAQKNQASAVPKTTVIDKQDNDKITAGNSVAEQEVEVEYDLSDAKVAKTPSSKPVILGTYKAPKKQENKPAQASEVKTESLKGIFVQTGAFSSMRNAKKSAASMGKFAKVQVEESSKNGKKIYRVLLGSFANKSKANQTVKKIKSAGHDAIIVRK